MAKPRRVELPERTSSAPILFEILDPPLQYTRYEDTIPANQNDRKLKVYDRKLEGSHSIFDCYFAKYVAKTMGIHTCGKCSYTTSRDCHQVIWSITYKFHTRKPG